MALLLARASGERRFCSLPGSLKYGSPTRICVWMLSSTCQGHVRRHADGGGGVETHARLARKQRRVHCERTAFFFELIPAAFQRLPSQPLHLLCATAHRRCYAASRHAPRALQSKPTHPAPPPKKNSASACRPGKEKRPLGPTFPTCHRATSRAPTGTPGARANAWRWHGLMRARALVRKVIPSNVWREVVQLHTVAEQCAAWSQEFASASPCAACAPSRRCRDSD